MIIYYFLYKFRKIKGLENVKYVDFYVGSKGNLIRYLFVVFRINDLKVIGVDNLFCVGEKSGLFVGYIEVICIGILVGYNVVKLVMGMLLLIFFFFIVIGDLILYVNEKVVIREGRKDRYIFVGVSYFKRM